MSNHEDAELIEKIAYYCEDNDQASLYDYITDHTAKAIERAKIEARIDERRRMEDEIEDVLTRHNSNRDLSPIAEIRDYLKNSKVDLKAQLEGDQS